METNLTFLKICGEQINMSKLYTSLSFFVLGLVNASSVAFLEESKQDNLLFSEPNPPKWPDNVYVFAPGDGSAQATIDRIHAENGGQNPPFHGQWSESRYAFLFEPGYHDLYVNVGYYTSVVGLGKNPGNVNIKQV